MRICTTKGCNAVLYGDSRYCEAHAGKCLDCGRQITKYSSRCGSCARKASNGARSASMLKATKKRKARVGSYGPVGYYAELRQVIEDYEAAVADGSNISLCRDAIAKLKAPLPEDGGNSPTNSK